jgi:hypothetical protein
VLPQILLGVPMPVKSPGHANLTRQDKTSYIEDTLKSIKRVNLSKMEPKLHYLLKAFASDNSIWSPIYAIFINVILTLRMEKDNNGKRKVIKSNESSVTNDNVKVRNQISLYPSERI